MNRIRKHIVQTIIIVIIINFFFFFANGITFNKKTKQRKSHKQKRAKKASIKEKKIRAINHRDYKRSK